jgi:hypothetical protein
MALALALALAASAQPIISRVSSGAAAAPNDTIVLAGVGLANCSALLCPLSGLPCLSLPPQPSSWDGGLKFTLPAASAPAAYSVAACCGAVCSNASQAQRYALNAPRAAWALGTGDAPGSVEAGGTLRVVGAALALSPATGACAPLTAATTDYAPGALDPARFPPGAAAALAAAPAGTASAAWLCPAGGGSGACVPLPPPLLASCHRLDLAIPPATPPGAYSLRVSNGLAASNQGLGALDSELALTVAPARALPAAPALTVGTDCSIQDCLRAAKAAGGGRVHVPAGVWAVPSGVALELAAGTTLTGEGADASVLRWGANTLAAPVAAALTCTGPALLAGLALEVASPAVSALVFAGRSGCRGEGLRVSVDTLAGFPSWGIGPAFSTSAGAGSWALAGSLLLHRGNCSGQSWPHNTAYTVWGAHDGLFANNTVLCYCQGHSTDSSQRIFFDGNAVFSLGADSQGSGFSTFENAQVLEHVYVGRLLDVGNPGAAKRWESMTLDGPGGAIFDTFAALSSDGAGGEEQVLTLLQPARSGPWGDRNISAQFLGASVAVLHGPGLGGTARVAGFTPTNASWQGALQLRLQPPLLTRPVPGSSYVAVNPFRGALVWEGVTVRLQPAPPHARARAPR